MALANYTNQIPCLHCMPKAPCYVPKDYTKVKSCGMKILKSNNILLVLKVISPLVQKSTHVICRCIICMLDIIV